MTILKCSATTCVYNKNELCSRGEIVVDGSQARQPDQTCCASFQERKESSTNSNAATGCGCEKIGIDCKAYECTYNSDCKCTAAAIDIGGSDACRCEETKCCTFECGCK